jgi:hypothetical protein
MGGVGDGPGDRLGSRDGDGAGDGEGAGVGAAVGVEGGAGGAGSGDASGDASGDTGGGCNVAGGGEMAAASDGRGTAGSHVPNANATDTRTRFTTPRAITRRVRCAGVTTFRGAPFRATVGCSAARTAMVSPPMPATVSAQTLGA